MKKMLSIVLAFLILSIGAQAQAFWVGSVYDNSTNSMVPGVMGFDWSSSGSGLIQGLTVGTAPVVGLNVNFLYQASLVGLTDSSGGPVAFPGLKTNTTAGFEYTVVAKLPETIIAVTPTGPVFNTLIATNPGGIFAIYNQKVGDANVHAGTGFNNGTLVATGTINGGALTTFTSTNFNPLVGMGSTILEGLVSYANPLFLDPALTILDFRFEGTINSPALDSTTVRFFDGNDGFTVTSVGNNTIVKSDGSSKFSSIPEPSTVLLLGVGLLTVAGFARRRIQK